MRETETEVREGEKESYRIEREIMINLKEREVVYLFEELFGLLVPDHVEGRGPGQACQIWIRPGLKKNSGPKRFLQ